MRLRAGGVRLAVLTMVLALLQVGWIGSAGAPAATAATAAVPPVDCSSGSIYTLNWGLTLDASGVSQLPTGQVGSTTVSPSPAFGYPYPGGDDNIEVNGLGIGAGGTSMWAVSQWDTTLQNPDSPTTNVYGWSNTTNTWTTYPGAASDNLNEMIVGGAVDPANGIYYYVAYPLASTGTPVGELFGFNTKTDTPVDNGSAPLAYLILPAVGGTAGDGLNGDIAFDSQGNLYVLSGTRSGTSSISALPAAQVPATAPNGAPPSLTTTAIGTWASKGENYNGIAYDANGLLYIQYADNSTGDTDIIKVNPADGTTVAGPSLVGGGVLYGVDLASCSTPPTLELQKNLPEGRAVANDQFALSITGNGITVGNTATTTGTASGLQTPIVGPLTGLTGATYTFSEALAPVIGSSSLAAYRTTASCTDTSNSGDVLTPSAVTTNGTTASFTLTAPSGQTNAPTILCTLTNTPPPTITLTKALSSPREAAGDQFTVALRTGGPSGTVVNSTANSTTRGSGATVTPGSGTTGAYVATAGMPYTLTEAAAGTATLADYAATISCTDSNGLQPGLPNGAPYDPASPPSITPVQGANISCVITNTAAPIISYGKTVDKGAGTTVNPGDTLTYTLSIVNSGSVPSATVSPVDDLSGVLNDATFDTGSVALTPAGSGTATYSAASKSLTWTGVVPAFTTVTVSYTVTVNGGAFGHLSNVFLGNTVTNPISGSLAWRKVDATPASNVLSGAVFTLTPVDSSGQATGPALTVTDCVSAPCSGPDANAAGGQFIVKGLTPGGAYRLVETTAPAGYLVNPSPVTVTVSTTTQTTTIPDVVDQQVPPLVLPLTGGVGTDVIAYGSIGILSAAGALSAWQWLRRRRDVSRW